MQGISEIAEKITESELEVMKAVWQHGGPATYAQIRDALQDADWTADTVHTLIRRLHQKGVLTRTKEDVFYYTPNLTEAQYMEAKTKEFVGKIYGGNVKGLLSALAQYDNVDEQALEDLKDYWRKGRRKSE